MLDSLTYCVWPRLCFTCNLERIVFRHSRFPPEGLRPRSFGILLAVWLFDYLCSCNLLVKSLFIELIWVPLESERVVDLLYRLDDVGSAR